jgi:hypothetical protein
MLDRLDWFFEVNKFICYFVMFKKLLYMAYLFLGHTHQVSLCKFMNKKFTFKNRCNGDLSFSANLVMHLENKPNGFENLGTSGWFHRLNYRQQTYWR